MNQKNRNGAALPAYIKPGGLAVQTPESTDIIIAVMGTTGAGKSTFINILRGTNDAPVGKSMKSETKYVQHYVFVHPQYPERRILMADTPGFDDTEIDNKEILRRIAVWLSKSYREGLKIAGLLYLRDITEKKVKGSEKVVYQIFKNLCGKEGANKIVLVTSMWDDLVNLEIGAEREKELKNKLWKDVHSKGQTIRRFHPADQKSALEIVDSVLSHNHTGPLQIQREMVDQQKLFTETTAYTGLQAALVLPVDTSLRDFTVKNPKTDNVIRVMGATRAGTVGLANPREFTVRDPKDTDIIIAVMGAEGAGKSTFINILRGTNDAPVGYGMDHTTKDVQDYVFVHPEHPGHRILMVDTPGFDDTRIDDKEILRRIAVWLSKSYQEGMKIAGLIYLWDININKIKGPRILAHDIVKDICGEDGAKKVVLATTMWDELVRLETGRNREEDLKEGLWSDMYSKGATICRFHPVNRQSALEIVDSVLSHDHVRPLQIQREMIDQKKLFTQTKAYARLQEWDVEWKKPNVVTAVFGRLKF